MGASVGGYGFGGLPGNAIQGFPGMGGNGSSPGSSGFSSGASAGFNGLKGGPCPCFFPFQVDIDASGTVEVYDVIALIAIAFSGDPDPQDPLCPRKRGDVNNDGLTDVFDVIYEIATAFSGGPSAVDPCL